MLEASFIGGVQVVARNTLSAFSGFGAGFLAVGNKFKAGIGTEAIAGLTGRALILLVVICAAVVDGVSSLGAGGAVVELSSGADLDALTIR